MSGEEREHLTDEDLADKLRRDPTGPDGRAAATELFERYRERVYLWCVRRVRNHEAALDLAQDVLVSAYRSVGAFEGRCRYATWVFTIARNRCFRALRTSGIVLDDSVESDDLPSSQRTPDIRLEEEEDKRHLLHLIRTELDAEEQVAIWLRCVEHLAVDEITRRLEIHAPSGARGVLQSARRKLRKALEHQKRKGSG